MARDSSPGRESSSKKTMVLRLRALPQHERSLPSSRKAVSVRDGPHLFFDGSLPAQDTSRSPPLSPKNNIWSSSIQGSPPSPLDDHSMPKGKNHPLFPKTGWKSPLGKNTPSVRDTTTPANRPASCPPSCWTGGGLSIKQLDEFYRMTFRPIKVHKGRIVGRGPVYS